MARYVLALKFCQNQDLEQYMSWTIHGLWPQYPHNNASPMWNYQALKPILPLLQKYWQTDYVKTQDALIVEKADQAFWKHEYQKHGTRMWPACSEVEYFKLVLSLYHHFLPTVEKVRPYHPHQEYHFYLEDLQVINSGLTP